MHPILKRAVQAAHTESVEKVTFRGKQMSRANRRKIAMQGGASYNGPHPRGAPSYIAPATASFLGVYQPPAKTVNRARDAKAMRFRYGGPYGAPIVKMIRGGSRAAHTESVEKARGQGLMPRGGSMAAKRGLSRRRRLGSFVANAANDLAESFPSLRSIAMDGDKLGNLIAGGKRASMANDGGFARNSRLQGALARRAYRISKMIRGGSRAAQKHLERQRAKLRAKAEKDHMNYGNDFDDDFTTRPASQSGRAYTRLGAEMGARKHTIGRLGDAIDYLRERRQRRWDDNRWAKDD